jgi:hypothetical protein
MWFIQQLLALWQRRLVGLRELAADPDMGTNWLWRARVRILSFLISRYSDPMAAAREESRASVDPYAPVLQVFLVEPRDAPPKNRQNIAGVLHAIRAVNAEARRRLRWRWF